MNPSVGAAFKGLGRAESRTQHTPGERRPGRRLQVVKHDLDTLGRYAALVKQPQSTLPTPQLSHRKST